MWAGDVPTLHEVHRGTPHALDGEAEIKAATA
jgi:hypothetical protein